jgi:hypothetical protein
MHIIIYDHFLLNQSKTRVQGSKNDLTSLRSILLCHYQTIIKANFFRVTTKKKRENILLSPSTFWVSIDILQLRTRPPKKISISPYHRFQVHHYHKVV